MRTSHSVVGRSLRALVMAFTLVASAGCGGAEAPVAADTLATQEARSGSAWECNPDEWCRVATQSVPCGPGELDAYAFPTEGGGYCIQRNACGPDTQLCAGPIYP